MKYKNKKGSKYKSSLEEFTSKELNLNKLIWFYEPIKIKLVEEFVYPEICWEKVGKIWKEKPDKIRPITYTPDFCNSDDINSVNWIIETKGFFTPEAKIKWKLFKKWLVDSNLKWRLFMPTNQNQVKSTINFIKNGMGKN